MEESRSVKLDLSVADLKKSINELRDAVIKAKATGQDFTATLSELRNKQGQLDEAMKLGKEDVKAYNAEMKSAQKEIKGYESAMLSVEKYSDKWYEYARAAGKLKDNIKDAKDAAKAFASDTRAMDNIVGIAKGGIAAFGVWTSTLAVFGVENEKVVQSIQKLQAVTTALSSIQQLQNALMNKSVGLGWLWNKGLQVLGATETKAAVQTEGLAGATTTYTTATNGAKAATVSFNNILKKTIWGAILTGVAVAISAVISNWDKLVAKFKSGKKTIEDVNKTFERTKKDADDLYRNTLANLYSSYKQLQAEWNHLASEHDRNEWIKKNQTEFQNLGLKINDVVSAENTFKSNDQAIIQSFTKRAMAAAAAAQAVALYQEAMNIEDEKRKLDLEMGERLANAKGKKGTVDATTGALIGYKSAEQERMEIMKEWADRTEALTNKQDTLNRAAGRYIQQAVENGEETTKSWNNAGNTLDKYIEKLNKAAAGEVTAAKEAKEAAKDAAELAKEKGEIDETEYKKRLIAADKAYANSLDAIAKKYAESEEVKTALTKEAAKERRRIEIEEVKLTNETKEEIYKKANEAVKKDFEDTMAEIERDANNAELAAKNAYYSEIEGLDPNDSDYQKKKEEAEKRLQDKLWEIRNNARLREIEANKVFYNTMKSLQEEFGNDEIDYEKRLQDALTAIYLKGVDDRHKGEEKKAYKHRRWSEADAKERKKIVEDWANVTSKLVSGVGDILEADLQRRVDNGDIEEEEAKKQFDRIKWLKAGEVVMQTYMGATAAYMNTVDTYPPPAGQIYGAINAGIAVATGLANLIKINNTKFGGSGGSSSIDSTSSTPAAPTVHDVQVAPLLNQRLDSMDMTAMSADAIASGRGTQRVVILQSDIEKSNNQVKTRVNQTSF